ncbi:MAG TPA: hypothetical protein VN759_09005 [Pseudolysinimonas sp.]|nr:hypothetical protein [Pseudolysinimonas sp.]
MSSIRNPIGPQPPQVYWRRRLVVLLGVLAVIVVIVLIIVRPGSGSPKAVPSPSNSPSGLPSTLPSSSSSGGPAGDCDPSVITLTAITDAASYAAGVQPMLSMSIVNSGATACKLDVGTKAQDYVITSGADTIWNSTDCQQNPASTVVTLQPGKAVTTQPFAWPRTRSSASTCSATAPPQVTAGGASYHLQVKVGSITSAKTKQFVLN